ncbi:MAG: hypothetical protein LBH13_06610 [Cellulomonadaceae bacterium]|jgi:hypothetical protein|nr:hypothetical protein [Cellulomonadaceae bacterium]
MALIAATDTRTGIRYHVPAGIITHPVLGKHFSVAAEDAPQTTSEPASEATVKRVRRSRKKKATTATNTPDSGENKEII